MALASSWAFWWPLALIAGAALAIWGGWRGRAFLLIAGLAVGVTDGLVMRNIKSLVGRPRPHEALEGIRTPDLARTSPRFLALGRPLEIHYSPARIQPPSGRSFPSSHTSNMFALAAVTMIFFRRWGWLVAPAAVLVAYSRLYTGAHWPLDVLIGAFLGFGVGLLTAAACEGLWRKFSPRLAPGLAVRHPTLFGLAP